MYGALGMSTPSLHESEVSTDSDVSVATSPPCLHYVRFTLLTQEQKKFHVFFLNCYSRNTRKVFCEVRFTLTICIYCA